MGMIQKAACHTKGVQDKTERKRYKPDLQVGHTRRQPQRLFSGQSVRT